MTPVPTFNSKGGENLSMPKSDSLLKKKPKNSAVPQERGEKPLPTLSGKENLDSANANSQVRQQEKQQNTNKPSRGEKKAISLQEKKPEHLLESTRGREKKESANLGRDVKGKKKILGRNDTARAGSPRRRKKHPQHLHSGTCRGGGEKVVRREGAAVLKTPLGRKKKKKKEHRTFVHRKKVSRNHTIGVLYRSKDAEGGMGEKKKKAPDWGPISAHPAAKRRSDFCKGLRIAG